MKTTTPFIDHISYTAEEYIREAPWTEIQFGYEVLGLSTPQLAATFVMPLEIINDMAEDADWEDHSNLSSEELDSRTNDYYKRARMQATALLAGRTNSIYNTLSGLEDRLLTQIEKSIEELEDADKATDIKTLQRLTNTLIKINDKYKMLEEAVIAPAQRDRKIRIEDGNLPLAEMLDAIDGEGRVLPSETPRDSGTAADADSQSTEDEETGVERRDA